MADTRIKDLQPSFHANAAAPVATQIDEILSQLEAAHRELPLFDDVTHRVPMFSTEPERLCVAMAQLLDQMGCTWDDTARALTADLLDGKMAQDTQPLGSQEIEVGAEAELLPEEEEISVVEASTAEAAEPTSLSWAPPPTTGDFETDRSDVAPAAPHLPFGPEPVIEVPVAAATGEDAMVLVAESGDVGANAPIPAPKPHVPQPMPPEMAAAVAQSSKEPTQDVVDQAVGQSRAWMWALALFGFVCGVVGLELATGGGPVTRVLGISP